MKSFLYAGWMMKIDGNDVVFSRDGASTRYSCQVDLSDFENTWIPFDHDAEEGLLFKTLCSLMVSKDTPQSIIGAVFDMVESNPEWFGLVAATMYNAGHLTDEMVDQVGVAERDRFRLLREHVEEIVLVETMDGYVYGLKRIVDRLGEPDVTATMDASIPGDLEDLKARMLVWDIDPKHASEVFMTVSAGAEAGSEIGVAVVDYIHDMMGVDFRKHRQVSRYEAQVEALRFAVARFLPGCEDVIDSAHERILFEHRATV